MCVLVYWDYPILWIYEVKRVQNWFLTFCEEVIVSPSLSSKVDAKTRASIWNAWMCSDTFDHIFDLSGGDLANACLPYLNIDAYSTNFSEESPSS